jgi:hypothetical protein
MIMAQRTDGKQRAWWRYGVSVLVFGILVAVAGMTVASFFGIGNELGERQQQLDLIRQRSDRLRAKLLDQQAATVNQNPRLSGESATIAAAGFQQLTLRLIAQTSAIVQSVEIVPADSLDRPQDDTRDVQINLLVVLDASIVDLQRILFAAETRIPYIWIDGLKIQPHRSTGTPDVAGTAQALRVELALHALWQASGGGR